MISSSCKKLSRIELLNSVNHCMAKTLAKLAPNRIPENCKGYLEKKHKNEVIYWTRDEGVRFQAGYAFQTDRSALFDRKPGR
ncbi:MAG: hypothetical protein K6U80_04530 [Firmicutes bacterium]|nr:hypothetical protein [Bacillota bacterium]